MKTFIIAEVAQAHDGSLGIAHSFIDAAADAGADAVKFQTHIAAAESTVEERFRVAFSRQDTTRQEYWRRMEFTPAQWAGLAAHAQERGIEFMSSPFSVAAVQLLRGVGVRKWKIGSGEVRTPDVLEAVLECAEPVFVSSGMSPWRDLDALVARVKASSAALTLMQCTSKYPTPLEEVGLNVLEEMRQRYGCEVGLSDHSGTIFPALAAIARGAAAVEVHVAFSRQMFGPDAIASLTFDELRLVTQARDAIALMDANPVDKDGMSEALAGMRTLFGKSIAPARALSAGTVLVAGDLTLKKPGTGIAAEALAGLVGRRLRADVVPDRLLRWEDVEQ